MYTQSTLLQPGNPHDVCFLCLIQYQSVTGLDKEPLINPVRIAA